jgi:ATP-dependent DNA ligase
MSERCVPYARNLNRSSERNPRFLTDVTERGATFIQPKLVAQIAHTQWTKDLKLRHPVFLGLRDDKDPAEVTKEA